MFIITLLKKNSFSFFLSSTVHTFFLRTAVDKVGTSSLHLHLRRRRKLVKKYKCITEWLLFLCSERKEKNVMWQSQVLEAMCYRQVFEIFVRRWKCWDRKWYSRIPPCRSERVGVLFFKDNKCPLVRVSWRKFAEGGGSGGGDRCGWRQQRWTYSSTVGFQCSGCLESSVFVLPQIRAYKGMSWIWSSSSWRNWWIDPVRGCELLKPCYISDSFLGNVSRPKRANIFSNSKPASYFLHWGHDDKICKDLSARPYFLFVSLWTWQSKFLLKFSRPQARSQKRNGTYLEAARVCWACPSEAFEAPCLFRKEACMWTLI